MKVGTFFGTRISLTNNQREVNKFSQFLNAVGNALLTPTGLLMKEGRTATCVTVPEGDDKVGAVGQTILFGKMGPTPAQKPAVKGVKAVGLGLLAIPGTLFGFIVKGTALLTSPELRKRYNASERPAPMNQKAKDFAEIAICIANGDEDTLKKIIQDKKDDMLGFLYSLSDAKVLDYNGYLVVRRCLQEGSDEMYAYDVLYKEYKEQYEQHLLKEQQQAEVARSMPHIVSQVKNFINKFKYEEVKDYLVSLEAKGITCAQIVEELSKDKQWYRQKRRVMEDNILPTIPRIREAQQGFERDIAELQECVSGEITEAKQLRIRTILGSQKDAGKLAHFLTALFTNSWVRTEAAMEFIDDLLEEYFAKDEARELVIGASFFLGCIIARDDDKLEKNLKNYQLSHILQVLQVLHHVKVPLQEGEEDYQRLSAFCRELPPLREAEKSFLNDSVESALTFAHRQSLIAELPRGTLSREGDV